MFAEPTLDDVQRTALDALRRDGIALLDARSLVGDELWNEALADVQPFIRETEQAIRDLGDQPASKDEVIIRRFLSRLGKKEVDGQKPEKPRFPSQAPWVRLAAAQPLLDLVNSYRGELNRLYEVDQWYTVPYPRSVDRVDSQRWHRDPEHAHVVKVFAYFTDVDEEAGPFEYVRGSAEGGRYHQLWPWADGHRYVAAEELEAAVAPDDLAMAMGPQGTIVIADTGGFHRGGFARTKPRVLATLDLPAGGHEEASVQARLQRAAGPAPAAGRVRTRLGPGAVRRRHPSPKRLPLRRRAVQRAARRAARGAAARARRSLAGWRRCSRSRSASSATTSASARRGASSTAGRGEASTCTSGRACRSRTRSSAVPAASTPGTSRSRSRSRR